ncbi:type III-B CRISPR module RAMP protein Cmr6 [Thermotoga maritima]|uniref:CRISPR type III-associated protein domain-containing protein n=2 Tax=Thermotogaceae TaxID=188709 RepID=Q9X2B1_THEMA|nr:type III-B CRISPR module RAMP protein Cmr6 [Thermotoga maritima]AAD36854.1 conserved hypothetical protein [Thermotoga maritima MSB8]
MVKRMKLPESKNLSLYWEKYSFLLLEGSNSKDKEIVSKIFQTVEKLQSDFGKISSILKERREQLIKKRKPFINLKMRVKGKLLLGAGNPSSIEVGITLSRNYGLPIIPGTAVKGAFASFLFEFERDKYESLAHIFGDTEREGDLIFLDAIPVSDLKFSLDIVNPHFQPYYMKEKLPPNDWYDPVPIKYLVVSSGVFWFTVLESRSGVIGNSEKELIKQRFVEMLKAYGLGAKTSYGYGRFEEPS